ncbi:VOC family protein [Salinimicrobium sediminilitoris]|uniref:VOC family protein n=1 Tax=Salinimicrobium sediminilitoris TaxID=2876715 RepID=UPI001E2BC6A3|nr:VOC family protein [Salinimicrobium sediminilitoris]MCC8358718.1 VOC family protein [Salinimicrobium sediminilitoris]
MKSKNPVVWFEIYVDDLERAKKFYEHVLEVKLNELPSSSDSNDEMKMLAFPMEMEEDGASGALVKMTGVGAGGNSTIIYFRSEDCAVEEKRISNAGGKIFKPKMSIGEYGFIVLAYDTEGNMFGVHSQV